ncbi:hypothetical protein CRUP_031499, partial [Coryphaenoides rupestris]
MLGVSPKVNPEPTSSMFKKKPTGGKKTLGSKKGGLGAQKVSSQSFSELEKKAQAVDKLREKGDTATTTAADTASRNDQALTWRTRGSARMRNCAGCRGTARSRRSGWAWAWACGVMSDMHMIQQETPVGVKTTKPRRYIEEDDDDEGTFSP